MILEEIPDTFYMPCKRKKKNQGYSEIIFLVIDIEIFAAYEDMCNSENFEDMETNMLWIPQ